MKEQVEEWATFVKEHPNEWKTIHTKFINAQFEKADAFIKRLLKEPNGREKVIKAYNIKNLKGYKRLLG
jgi:hypothetical protein